MTEIKSSEEFNIKQSVSDEMRRDEDFFKLLPQDFEPQFLEITNDDGSVFKVPYGRAKDLRIGSPLRMILTMNNTSEESSDINIFVNDNGSTIPIPEDYFNFIQDGEWGMYECISPSPIEYRKEDILKALENMGYSELQHEPNVFTNNNGLWIFNGSLEPKTHDGGE